MVLTETGCKNSTTNSKYFNKKFVNILVFGKDGQLGRAFVSLFKRKPSSANAQIIYLSRAECDLSKEADVIAALKDVKPNLIINASAYTAVDKAETEVDLAFAVNAKAPEIMACYAAENDATFFALLHRLCL